VPVSIKTRKCRDAECRKRSVGRSATHPRVLEPHAREHGKINAHLDRRDLSRRLGRRGLSPVAPIGNVTDDQIRPVFAERSSRLPVFLSKALRDCGPWTKPANFLATFASTSAVTGHFARGRVVPAMPTRKDIIVLDNGGSTIKVGFAGDETPALYVPPFPSIGRT
jgi:hypothetical protein